MKTLVAWKEEPEMEAPVENVEMEVGIMLEVQMRFKDQIHMLLMLKLDSYMLGESLLRKVIIWKNY